MFHCLTFSFRCSTLHVSAYMDHLQVCMMFHFYIPEEICFAGFVFAFCCTWLYFARFHLCFSVLFFFVNFAVSCVSVCLAAGRRQHNLKTYWTIQCSRMLKYSIISQMYCIMCSNLINLHFTKSCILSLFFASSFYETRRSLCQDINLLALLITSAST
jgi:hypothetical protein